MGRLRAPIAIVATLAGSKADVVWIRSSIQFGLFQALGALVLRIRKRRVIAEIPTPLQVARRELLGGNHRMSLVRALTLMVLDLTFPAVLWPASVVVEYSGEARRFLVGIESKTIYIGNGIDHFACRILSGVTSFT